MRKRADQDCVRRWSGVPGVLAVSGLLVVLALSGPARASETTATTTRVYGSTTTYFLQRQVLDPSDPTSRLYQMPIYEYLTVGADAVGVPGFSIHLSGWGNLNLLNRAGGDWFDGDLLVGTLSYRCPKGRFEVRLGRQILYEGAGNNAMMDGLYLKVRPGANVELSAFTGWVPYQGFDFALDRIVFGGRVAYNPWDWGRIGVSYTGQRADGQFDRSNLGFDYALRYRSNLEFSGYVLADMVSATFQETRNALSYLLGRDWRFTLDYGTFNPSGRIPKTSIFSVFTSARYHRVGADVTYRGAGWLGASLYGRYYHYEGDDPGYEVGFRPVLRFDHKGYGNQVGLEVARLKGFGNAYTQARLFGIWRPLKGFQLTADVDNYFYDDGVRGWEAWRTADPGATTAYVFSDGGYRRSHIVGMTAGYEVFEGARLQGDVSVAVNPDFRQAWSGLIKFHYEFAVRPK
jgi:hypothetical protein